MKGVNQSLVESMIRTYKGAEYTLYEKLCKKYGYNVEVQQIQTKSEGETIQAATVEKIVEIPCEQIQASDGCRGEGPPYNPPSVERPAVLKSGGGVLDTHTQTHRQQLKDPQCLSRAAEFAVRGRHITLLRSKGRLLKRLWMSR